MGDGVNFGGVERLPRGGAPDDERWELEFSLRVPPCLPVQVGPGGCHIDSAREWDPQRPLIWQHMRPFGFEAQLGCSLPLEGVDLLAEARSALDRASFPRIGAELYSGSVARAQNWSDNRYLTRSDDPVSPITVLSDAPMPLVGALGLIDSYLTCCVDGGHGVVHAPAALLAAMGSDGHILAPSTPAGRRYTWGGNVVVAECGYTGEAPGTFAAGPQFPGANVLWLYVTSTVAIRVGFGPAISSDEDVAALIVVDNNTVAVTQGMGLGVWGCCHAGVPVDCTDLGLGLDVLADADWYVDAESE